MPLLDGDDGVHVGGVRQRAGWRCVRHAGSGLLVVCVVARRSWKPAAADDANVEGVRFSVPDEPTTTIGDLRSVIETALEGRVILTPVAARLQ